MRGNQQEKTNGKRALRNSWHRGLTYCEEPLLAFGTRLAFFVQEDFFDIFPEYAGDFKGQVQPRFVFARLNRVDALPRHAYGISQVGLRPLLPLSGREAESSLLIPPGEEN